MGGRNRGFRARNSVEARAALGLEPLIRRNRGTPRRVLLRPNLTVTPQADLSRCGSAANGGYRFTTRAGLFWGRSRARGPDKANVPQGDTYWSESTTLRGLREPGPGRRNVRTWSAGGTMGASGLRVSSIGSRFPSRHSRRLRAEPVVVSRCQTYPK